jgi:hypothetical protein
MSHFVAVTLFMVNVEYQDVNGVQPKEHEHPLSSNFLLFSSSTRSVWHEIQVNTRTISAILDYVGYGGILGSWFRVQSVVGATISKLE